MKKISLTGVALMLCIFSYSQEVQQTQLIQPTPQKIERATTHSTPITGTFHGVTGRLDQFVAPPGTVNEITKSENLGYDAKDDWVVNENPNPADKLNGPDPVLQTSYPAPAPPTKALTQNWAAMGYTGVNPADPSVDVGPNHVVQMINGGSGSYIQVYTKAGATIGAQVYFDNFMGMPGGAGDPIVLYDERADRWFLSEFSSSGNNLHVAISTTADPGGAYNTYTFNSPGGFPDYPKYSIWENEYVMTANVNTPDIFAFNRADMLAGSATTAQQFSQNNYGTIGFQAATPVSLNGTTLPPSGQPALLMRMRDNSWTGVATDALEMWELDIDWVTPANSSLSQVQTLGITPHESELCGYTSFNCFAMPGTGTTLDPLRELLMNRIHYRNFGTHESIVCSHVTDADGNDRGGIRWYELRRTGGTAGTWAIYQEGTYSPDTDNRWMPSIGISASGNIGIAYSVSSSTTFPSLRYTGRKECDPLGTMTEPETTIMAGTASNASNRWGDYFQMGTDPSDGETFYFTGCYNVSTQWSTRIAAFAIDVCINAPEVSFDNPTAISVDEATAAVPNGCLDYTVVNVPISIALAPSADADVVVSATGGTATLGEDFDILSVSHTLNGGNMSGTVELRVYNDDYVEGTETIILTYTLNANGGDATAAATNQSVTVTINDDDLDPTSMFNTITIFSDDFEDGTMAPFSTVNAAGAPNDPWQVGNNAAGSSAAYAIPTSNVGQFAWLNDDACNCVQDDVDLEFPSVDLTGYAASTLTFLTYFEDNTYLGDNENADLTVSISGGADVVVGPLVASVIDGSWITQSFDITPYIGNNDVVFKVNYSDATGWLYGCTVDDVLITGTQPIGIQTPVNTGSGDVADLGPNGTVHFYDPSTGEVMLTLANTSSFDYGCVTVEVDRPGTAPSSVQFNTATAADYLHSKTFTIVPTNTNPTGTYDVTLYYEEAEVAAWEAATGNSRNNAEVVKVDGANQISDVTPATAASYTISSIAAAVGAFYGDVTFTSSFSTGFSGFGVGIYNAVMGTPPLANFSATPTTICEGATVSFTDLSSNTPTGWSWDFGDTGSSTAQNPTHVYATAGNYTVTLTATNGSGSDPHTITNYITVNAIPTVGAAGTTTICDGASTTISGSGATTYSWDQGLGAGSSFSVSPSTTTTYNVIGTTLGCSNTAAVTITVTPSPTVVGAGATTICDGASTTISGSGATTYSWDQGLGAGSSFSVSPSTTTTYNVTGTTSGCSNTDAVTITVTPLPSVVGTGTITICDGASTTISGSGATTYSWDQGLGAGSSFSVSPSTTTTYTVTGTTSGCTNTDAVTVTVTPIPSITLGTVTDPTTCATATGSIVVAGSGTGNVSWTGAASGSATGVPLPYTITGLGAGSYTITYVEGAGCTSNVLVQALVDPSAPSVTASGTATICAGASTTISGSGATTYSWDQGLGAGSSFSVSPAVTTTYNVTGTTAGCSGGASVTITVTPTPTVVGIGTTTICEGASTTISGSGATTYSWDQGLGAGPSFSVSPTTTTTYTVTGTLSGCSNTDVVTVTVLPAPTVVGIGTTTICEGASTTISGSGAITYSWDQGLGAGSSFSVSPTTTTTYTVTGTAGSCSNTDAVTITVTPSPAVVGAGTTTICEGASTTISGSGATTYSWDQGLGAGSSFSVSPTTTTTYTVTGTSSGCSNTDAVTITVNATPVITTGTVTDPTVCATATGSIVVNGSGTGNVSWTGTASGSATSVPMPYTIAGLAAGSYTITYVDGNGCTANTLVESLSDPSAPTIVATGTATICAGNSTAIDATGGTTYAWDNGLGAGASQTVSPTVTTTYIVTGTTGGCSSSDQVTVTVMDPTTSTQSVEICEGSSYTVLTSTYTATGTYTDVTVNSVGCDSTITTNLTVNPNPIVSVTPSVIDTMCSSGSGSISLIGTPAGGTFSGTGVTGAIFDPTTAGVGSHTITYDYTDGNGCAGSTSVIAVVVQCAGIEETGLDGVSLYPNPNEGLFVITGLAIGVEYTIYDDRGRIVANGITESEKHEVSIPSAETGIYYLNSIVNGEYGSLKFLITK